MSIGVQENRYNFSKTICFLLSGKAGVGKSYTANLLNGYLTLKGYNQGIYHFADGVKKTAIFMGWNGNKDQQGRILLQGIGQTGRAYDEYLWVRDTFKRIEDSEEYPYDFIIIDDWRFKNEYRFIASNEILYRPIKIRIEAPARELLIGTPAYNEISEVDLDGFDLFDYIISNDEDGYEHLFKELLNILQIEIEDNLRK